MLSSIMCIIAGLVLLTGVLRVIPAIGGQLEKVGKWLGSFQTIIGLIALVIGIMSLSSLQGMMLVIAGIVLLAGVLSVIPAMGKYLEKLAKILTGFQVPIGIITLIIGIMGFL
ncbi:MAG: putative membrane protein [Candidatus Methanohalarchaeum thermophilum]|uniref:Membrane protein n=1 Tax=Methanohalarchaeum thermophilum TaxID=1903181 RepID=A0A1Q6DSK0_METT1|nr:MAG: putative membrane protein [Candidatus Methanohalarchaeum thermophilum]